MANAIKKHGGQNRLTYTTQDGKIIGLSYGVPVFVLHKNGVAFTTDEFYSVTTSKHQNLFVRENAAAKPEKIGQEYMNKMSEEAKGFWR